jgi:DNA polymerase I-like protein with 3'-5' exonuclease and polymerase domains
VFASFYGASYNSIGSSLWEYIDESGEVCGTGETLKDHMAKIGVTDHDTCLQHAEKVFDWYWHDLFAEYGAWKEEVWQIYKRQGYLDYPTGFRVTCQMTKTQAMNTIIQGSTFHLLLYTLVELQKRFVKYKLKSKIVCQIHDSIVLDVVPDEWDTIRQLYLEAQASVREVWKWLIYPISADAEIGDVGGSWAKMNEYGALAS